MCGILGIVRNSAEAPARLDRALASLRHRGPDDEGIWNEGSVTLVHTRLSILDVSPLGHQPMLTPEGRYVIVYNGEIYNHKDIRAELLAIGHVFKSSSDTETILHAFAEWGEAMLDKLNGIFAMAIHDRKLNELFVARDHFGIKPLYYVVGQGLFAFASELKALTALGLEVGGIDPRAIANYLHFLWCPGEGTPFTGVRKLLPGHFIRIDGSAVKAAPPHRYYVLPFDGRRLRKRDEEEWVDTLDRQLTLAVERQMLSDVPVGFFLSGGLDSSLLLAIARKLRPKERFQAFTIEGMGGNSEGYADDLPYARMVARHLEVDLGVVRADPSIAANFDLMVWHLDEPQADAAPINVLNICRFARSSGIKVLIGGAAGDDLFSGYRRHQALQYERTFQLIPGWIWRALSSMLRRLPTSIPAVRRGGKLLRDADKPALDRLVGYFGWIDQETLTGLFSPAWRNALGNYSPDSYLKSRLAEIPAEDSILNRMLYCEMVGFMVDHNLNYTDKLGMAVGVEVRVPYLDRDVVNLACRMPPELKMRGPITKYLLRKVAERYLPHDVIYRPKTGFGAPVREWITGALHPMVCERLSRERLQHRGIFDPAAVWNLIERNRRGEIDASYIVWSLLAIESWMQQFYDPLRKKPVI